MIQEQLKQLYELSRVMQKILAIRERVGHVPVRRRELEEKLKGTEQGFGEKKEKLETLEKSKREVETELQVNQQRLMEFQDRLNKLKTQKEYQAGSKEIGGIKQSISQMETKVLGLMTEIDTLTKEVEGEEGGFKTLQEASEQELKSLEEEEKKVAEETRDFEERRKALESQLPPALLAKYRRVQKVRPDAVAIVEGGICDGCHMRIPPQLFIEIQRHEKIEFCPSCHRILCLSGGLS